MIILGTSNRSRKEENFDCRGPNVSILHLRNASADPWEVGSQGSSYSVGSNKSQIASSRGKSGGNARGSYNRGSSIPSLKRHDTSTSTTPSSLKQHRQDSHGQVSNDHRNARNILLVSASLSAKSEVGIESMRKLTTTL